MVPMIALGRATVVAVTGVALAGALSACGDDAGSAGDGLRVEASFYPLAWVSEQIGGDLVQVDSLAKDGAEPHDLELTPGDVVDVAEADLVVYLRGFQPAVDEAVAEADEDKVFDARPAADLDLRFTPIEDGEDHDDEPHDDEAGTEDPHFWLDPTRLVAVATALAEALGDRAPEHRDTFDANLQVLVGRLEALDAELAEGLADCDRGDLVTSHNAFGYLARRYGLTQVGISGLSPDEEASPADLAAVSDFVTTKGVTTIFFETLVDPGVARTVAEETGASTDVLDPIEGLTDESQGDDYLEVMAANLANLRRGLGCR
jgi:zinc transport system substrate-binding protein